MYNLIIIGAGPAGVAAAVWAAENKTKTLIIGKDAPAVRPSKILAVDELLNTFQKQLAAAGSFLEYRKATALNLEKNIVTFSAEISTGQIFYGSTVVIATGKSKSGEGNADFENLTRKDIHGIIKADFNLASSVKGIFAAGDAVHTSIIDSFIAAGEGAAAAHSAILHLKSLK